MKTILILLASSLACFGQAVGSSAITTRLGSNTVVTIVAAAPVVAMTPGYWTTSSVPSGVFIELPTSDVPNPTNAANIVTVTNSFSAAYATNRWAQIPGTALYGQVITTNLTPAATVVMTVRWALTNGYAVWTPNLWTTNGMSQILGTTNKYPSGVVTTWADTNAPPDLGLGSNTNNAHWIQVTVPANQPLPPVSILTVQ